MRGWRPMLFFRLSHGSVEAFFKAVRFPDQRLVFANRGEYRIDSGRRCFAFLFGCHLPFLFLRAAGDTGLTLGVAGTGASPDSRYSCSNAIASSILLLAIL